MDRVLVEWTSSVTYSVYYLLIGLVVCVAIQDSGQSANGMDTISDIFSMLPSERFVLFLQYKTVDRVLAERPTVVMMAHINPLKDIVTAIRAAKLIVEEYKVTGVPHYINQSIYVSCLQDSSGESTDNVWEHNIH